jgi:hypothetical protein
VSTATPSGKENLALVPIPFTTPALVDDPAIVVTTPAVVNVRIV